MRQNPRRHLGEDTVLGLGLALALAFAVNTAQPAPSSNKHATPISQYERVIPSRDDLLDIPKRGIEISVPEQPRELQGSFSSSAAPLIIECLDREDTLLRWGCYVGRVSDAELAGGVGAQSVEHARHVVGMQLIISYHIFHSDTLHVGLVW
jgi:hypothetical protein